MPNEIETLVNREIARCVARIAECEGREAEFGTTPDAKLRAANDRDRDRAFISFARALKMRRELQKDQPEPVAAPIVHEAAPAAAPKAIAIARNTLCPCRSGQKYKRCCGRLAPPLHTAANPPSRTGRSVESRTT